MLLGNSKEQNSMLNNKYIYLLFIGKITEAKNLLVFILLLRSEIFPQFCTILFARPSKLSCCVFLQCVSYICYNWTPSFSNLWRWNCLLPHMWPHTSHLQQRLYSPTAIANSGITDTLKQHVLVSIYNHRIRYIIITVTFLMGPVLHFPCHPSSSGGCSEGVIVSHCRRWGLYGPGGWCLLSESLASFCLPISSFGWGKSGAVLTTMPLQALCTQLSFWVPFCCTVCECSVVILEHFGASDLMGIALWLCAVPWVNSAINTEGDILCLPCELLLSLKSLRQKW